MPQLMPIDSPEARPSFPDPGKLTHHETPRLTDLALLRDFSEEERESLCEAGSTTSFKSGWTAITESEQHSVLFIVLAGRFHIIRGGEKIAEITVGQICGEMEMLNPPFSTATVNAVTDATVWQLTRDELRSFMETHPKAGNRFMKLLANTFATRLQSG
ncbi:MAG: CRP-like cAMP-binding protein [Verrucomicrobiales bacterium]|jgi:CRP-like cAMP-binding protein